MDLIQVPRIENQVPTISEIYCRVPRMTEIRSRQVHTGYLIFSLKKPCICISGSRTFLHVDAQLKYTIFC